MLRSGLVTDPSPWTLLTGKQSGTAMARKYRPLAAASADMTESDEYRGAGMPAMVASTAPHPACVRFAAAVSALLLHDLQSMRITA